MSSSASESNNTSQYSSVHEPSPPSNDLDILLPLLIASKRSLSTVEYVYRANDLCASTRDALETSAVTTARTRFLRSGVDSQLNVLHKVHLQTETRLEAGRRGYRDVLAVLEEAEERLRVTLRDLQGTMVEAQLRPENEEPRNLLDFVHKDGVEGLVKDIRRDMHNVDKGFAEMEKQNQGFHEEIETITTILEPSLAGGAEKSRRNKSPQIEESPLPEILTDMEERAKDMAVDLESLVGHFDLCVKAIRHTEGGDDVAVRIAGDLPDGVDLGQNPQETMTEPISDEEKTDMMKVLQEDASQVNEVVIEIKSRIDDIELMHQQVDSHLETLVKDSENANSAFKLLESIGQKLPGHITRNQAFLTRWVGEKSRIEDRLEELEDAKGFYDGFVKAYDGLIIEVGRRKRIEADRNAVIADAMAKLEQLHEEDVEDRDRFKEEQGQFLPGDIWPGLLEPPVQYQFSPLEGKAERVPNISKSALHRAIDRFKSRALD